MKALLSLLTPDSQGPLTAVHEHVPPKKWNMMSVFP